jgi:hypothetical protein
MAPLEAAQVQHRASQRSSLLIDPLRLCGRRRDSTERYAQTRFDALALGGIACTEDIVAVQPGRPL